MVLRRFSACLSKAALLLGFVVIGLLSAVPAKAQESDLKANLSNLSTLYQNEVQRLDVNNPYIASDLDTWDDYLALHEEMFGAPPDSWTADQQPGSRSRTN